MRQQLLKRWRARATEPAQSGQVLVLTALFLVVLIGLLGLAIDVGHQMDRYREAQNTADAAALAGANALYLSSNEPLTATIQQAQTTAAEVVQANNLSSQAMQLSFLDSNRQVITNTAALSSASQIKYVKAAVQDAFTPYFIQVLGIKRSTVGTSAVAKVQWVPQCELCVLDRTAPEALDLSGSGGFTGTNIRVTVNSNAGNALYASGGGTFTDSGQDAQIYVVGGSNTSGGGAISPQPVSGIQPVPDPLGWVPVPAGIPLGSCVLDNNGNGNGNNNPCSGTPPQVKLDNSYKSTQLTINPGVYSSISVASSFTLVLNPGIYVVTGSFSAQSQSVITGNGVMIYLTCPSSSSPYYQACPSGGTSQNSMGNLSFAGGASVTLSAPTASQATLCNPVPSTAYACPSTTAYLLAPSYVPWQYTGILIFQDRNDSDALALAGTSTVTPPASCTTVTSGASCIAGTIYAKAAPLTISGGGSTQTPLQSFVIADTVNFTGNGGNGGSSQTFAMSFPVGVNAPLATANGLVQ